MADKMTVTWNKQALGRAIGTAPETLAAITEATDRILASCQYQSADFRTKKYKGKGDTPAQYASDVHSYRNAHVGIVYTANYAAQKDNMENNTLLKAVGTHG